MSDVIGVGEITWCHHLTDPDWKVQTAQDPCEDLHKQMLYSVEVHLARMLQHKIRSQAQLHIHIMLLMTHCGNIRGPVHVAYVIIGEASKQVH